MAREAGTELETLFRTEGPRLWRALLAHTGDPEIASDALAEAFAQALGRGAELRSPLAWTWKAAFRIAAGELKRRSRSSPSSAEPVATMPESVRDVVLALQHLPPRQRAAVVLHDYADRPTREVAAILGTRTGTVRVHLSQGRRRLRELLEERDV